MHPTRIRVGPHTYKITATQAAIDAASRAEQSDLYGYTHHGRLTISLAPDILATKQQEVLLHETLHCITEQAGITAELGPKDEERIVDRLAPLLLDTLRSNPTLVDYLLG